MTRRLALSGSCEGRTFPSKSEFLTEKDCAHMRSIGCSFFWKNRPGKGLPKKQKEDSEIAALCVYKGSPQCCRILEYLYIDYPKTGYKVITL